MTVVNIIQSLNDFLSHTHLVNSRRFLAKLIYIKNVPEIMVIYGMPPMTWLVPFVKSHRIGIWLNTLGPIQNGRHFADDTFKCIFLNENAWISIKISLKFVSIGPIKNIPALVQIMAWRRPGDKPLSEAMMANLPTHICVSRPEWVN